MGKTRRLSPKQKQAKIEAAKKSEEAAKRAKERSDRTKKIITVVVCLVLVLGLSVPTMALTVCSQMNKQANTENTQNANSGDNSDSSDSSNN